MAELFIAGDLLNALTTEDFLDKSMKEIIRKSDFSICNFEAPVDSDGQVIPKAGSWKSQKLQTVKILKENGFDMLLLANNHICDYGYEGLKATLDEIHFQGLHPIGAGLSSEEAYMPMIRNIGGLKIGYINASEAQFGQIASDHEDRGGYAWINHRRINEIVTSLKKEVDVLIFLAHAGLENYDVPLIEWRDRYKELCDLGADCVVAAHPHVPQGYEYYNGKPIFYSLGNFFFPKTVKNHTEDGLSLLLKIDEKKKISGEFIYHRIENGWLKRITEEESTISVDRLNGLLKEETYNKLVKELYPKAYESMSLKYFHSVFQVPASGDSLPKRIKKILVQLFFKNHRKRSRELLLLHLVRNETNRYVTQRTLQMKAEGSDDT
ncbi:CapA family protein [Marinilabilia rubra]|uniref:Capsule synthesis protein CapA domain-containing protein n=1 Tax=Marinilabilia rubra TaxID=2162893 RepID=A0A2U2B939_9BACT|nr:CapA family protein [Marinilabilia rubra]PWD99563.1 hypothetical protein DDZ16_08900 [Marinilabilia rubra]